MDWGHVFFEADLESGTNVCGDNVRFVVRASGFVCTGAEVVANEGLGETPAGGSIKYVF